MFRGEPAGSSACGKRKVQQTHWVYWTFWRRVRDSNPRGLSAYSISSAAPSTTRTTLHFIAFPKPKNRRTELRDRTHFIQLIRTSEPVENNGFEGSRSWQHRLPFRVRLVMTTSIRFHINNHAVFSTKTPTPAHPLNKPPLFYLFPRKKSSIFSGRLT